MNRTESSWFISGHVQFNLSKYKCLISFISRFSLFGQYLIETWLSGWTFWNGRARLVFSTLSPFLNQIWIRFESNCHKTRINKIYWLFPVFFYLCRRRIVRSNSSNDVTLSDATLTSFGIQIWSIFVKPWTQFVSWRWRAPQFLQNEPTFRQIVIQKRPKVQRNLVTILVPFVFFWEC